MTVQLPCNPKPPWESTIKRAGRRSKVSARAAYTVQLQSDLAHHLRAPHRESQHTSGVVANETLKISSALMIPHFISRIGDPSCEDLDTTQLANKDDLSLSGSRVGMRTPAWSWRKSCSIIALPSKRDLVLLFARSFARISILSHM